MDGTPEVYNLRAGVPQESVLLFLVYVNDIADEVLGLCRLFADDTSICEWPGKNQIWNLYNSRF
jgi:hypothetical protein